MSKKPFEYYCKNYIEGVKELRKSEFDAKAREKASKKYRFALGKILLYYGDNVEGFAKILDNSDLYLACKCAADLIKHFKMTPNLKNKARETVLRFEESKAFRPEDSFETFMLISEINRLN